MLALLPYWFFAGVAVALGLTFGSFLNVVIHRLPRGESVVHPGSRCPSCGAKIAPRDNVPLFSWLLLRGRARCCGARISPRYPLVELLGGLAGWATLERVLAEPNLVHEWVPYALFFAYLALVLGLLAAIFIDLEFMLLPDEITLGGVAVGLLTIPIRQISWSECLIGAAAGFLVVWLLFHELYRLVRGHPGMGLGDAKLLALAGAWFGIKGALFALLAGAIQGTVVTIAVLLVKGRIDEPEAVRRERQEVLAELERLEGPERAALEAELAEDPLTREAEVGIGQARIPFGPFLSLAILEYLFVGESILDAYLSTVWGS